MGLVFDDFERSDTDSHPHGEADFDYLNRSARPEAAKVRALIEQWLEHYPSTHRSGLVSRLRLRTDDAHRSAFFELMLHELVISHGGEVRAIEPSVPGSTHKPDFLVAMPNGAEFYLEAVLARGMTVEEAGAQRRLSAALRVIDETPSPHHFLDLRTEGTPATNVRLKDLRHKLRAWLARLPEGEAARSAAPFVYAHKGMTIRLHAWPRSQPAPAGRAIGVRHFGAHTATRADDIADVIEFKAGRYGRQLTRPLLLAVSSMGTFRHDEDALDVLLGSEQRTGSSGKALSLSRKPNGVWNGSTGPRAQQLSGVLWFKQIDPWNFAPRDPLIIPNPWATRPAPVVGFGIREIHLDGEKAEIVEGATLGEALGLPAGWPEDWHST